MIGRMSQDERMLAAENHHSAINTCFRYNTKNQTDSYPATLTTITNVAANEHDSTINHLVQHGFKLEGNKYNKHKAEMGGSAYVDFTM